MRAEAPEPTAPLTAALATRASQIAFSTAFRPASAMVRLLNLQGGAQQRVHLGTRPCHRRSEPGPGAHEPCAVLDEHPVEGRRADAPRVRRGPGRWERARGSRV